MIKADRPRLVGAGARVSGAAQCGEGYLFRNSRAEYNFISTVIRRREVTVLTSPHECPGHLALFASSPWWPNHEFLHYKTVLGVSACEFSDPMWATVINCNANMRRLGAFLSVSPEYAQSPLSPVKCLQHIFSP